VENNCRQLENRRNYPIFKTFILFQVALLINWLRR